MAMLGWQVIENDELGGEEWEWGVGSGWREAVAMIRRRRKMAKPK